MKPRSRQKMRPARPIPSPHTLRLLSSLASGLIFAGALLTPGAVVLAIIYMAEGHFAYWWGYGGSPITLFFADIYLFTLSCGFLFGARLGWVHGNTRLLIPSHPEFW